MGLGKISIVLASALSAADRITAQKLTENGFDVQIVDSSDEPEVNIPFVIQDRYVPDLECVKAEYRFDESRTTYSNDLNQRQRRKLARQNPHSKYNK